MYVNPWLYDNNPVLEIPPKAIGFVYCITNKQNGMKYVGKKKFYTEKNVLKTVVLKSGVKKKKKVKVVSESDWQDYYGSNTELQLCVGDSYDNFERTILYICTTLGEMSYLETYEIFVRHAIPSPLYYNTWCSVRVRSNHLPKGFVYEQS